MPDLQHAPAPAARESIDCGESMQLVARHATPPPAPRDWPRYGGLTRLPVQLLPGALIDDGLTDFELLAEADAADMRFAHSLREVRRAVEAERPSVPLRRRGRATGKETP